MDSDLQNSLSIKKFVYDVHVRRTWMSERWRRRRPTEKMQNQLFDRKGNFQIWFHIRFSRTRKPMCGKNVDLQKWKIRILGPKHLIQVKPIIGLMGSSKAFLKLYWIPVKFAGIQQTLLESSKLYWNPANGLLESSKVETLLDSSKVCRNPANTLLESSKPFSGSRYQRQTQKHKTQLLLLGKNKRKIYLFECTLHIFSHFLQ